MVLVRFKASWSYETTITTVDQWLKVVYSIDTNREGF